MDTRNKLALLIIYQNVQLLAPRAGKLILLITFTYKQAKTRCTPSCYNLTKVKKVMVLQVDILINQYESF